MKRYIIRKLLWLIPQMLIVSFVCFLLINLMSTDPAEASLRANGVPTITPELLAQRRVELGLDQPFLVRYWQWLLKALQGDFGTSYLSSTKTVLGELAKAALPSIYLAGVSLLLIIAASLLIGVTTAIYKGSLFDRVIRWVLFLLTAMPSFWMGLLLMWFFAVQLKWFNTSGMSQPNAIVLPAITLSLSYLSTYVRLIRNKMVEQEEEMYVTYARVRGLSKATILGYVLKNSLQSSLASMSMSIPKLIAGTVVVENIFAWPGLGSLIIDAIFNKDYPIIQGYIVLMAMVFILFGTFMDMLIYMLDPRIRGVES